MQCRLCAPIAYHEYTRCIYSQRHASSLFSLLIYYKICAMRVTYGHFKSRQGHLGLVLGLVSLLENILKENMAPSQLYSHTSANHRTPLLFAVISRKIPYVCIHYSVMLPSSSCYYYCYYYWCWNISDTMQSFWISWCHAHIFLVVLYKLWYDSLHFLTNIFTMYITFCTSIFLELLIVCLLTLCYFEMLFWSNCSFCLT